MIADGAERVGVWQADLEVLLERIGVWFGRRDLRGRMRDYVVGLLGPVGRKNGWQLAEYAGHHTPDGLQRLLRSARWDADLVRDGVRGFVAERLGEADAVLIVDDTGFVKKGTGSAGVARQYTGTSGKIDNCQIGVFAACASRRGRALIDRELYLPKAWIADAERCRAVNIPAGRGFATKPELARAMVDRLLDAGVPAGWVAADEAYGADYRFRQHCEQRGVGYVVAVPKNQQIPAAGLPTVRGAGRIDAVVAGLSAQAWVRLSAGHGAKGPRLYDWAAIDLSGVESRDGGEPTHHRWASTRCCGNTTPKHPGATFPTTTAHGRPCTCATNAGSTTAPGQCSLASSRLPHPDDPGDHPPPLQSTRSL